MDEQEQTLEFKPVDKLNFDPNNPRLPSIVNKRDEKAILEWMLRDATLIELMGSIAEQGYFPGEPLLVTPDSNSPGKFIVVEGNRRLAAVKLLNKPELASKKVNAVRQISDEAKNPPPKKLPVLEYPSEHNIQNYLGYRHITGIKAWGSLEKAKYLESLLKTVEDQERLQQHRSLAKTIGSRSDHVGRLLTTLNVYKKIIERDFFDLKAVDEESVKFAVLYTALGYEDIYKFLDLDSNQDRDLTGLNEENLKRLTSLVFQETSTGKPRVRESRDLGDFSKVVDSPAALAAFEQKGYSLTQAVLLTDEPNKIFRTSIQEARMNLETARDYVHLANGLAKTDSDSLFEIARLARTIQASVDALILEQAISQDT